MLCGAVLCGLGCSCCGATVGEAMAGIQQMQRSREGKRQVKPGDCPVAPLSAMRCSLIDDVSVTGCRRWLRPQLLVTEESSYRTGHGSEAPRQPAALGRHHNPRRSPDQAETGGENHVRFHTMPEHRYYYPPATSEHHS